MHVHGVLADRGGGGGVVFWNFELGAPVTVTEGPWGGAKIFFRSPKFVQRKTCKKEIVCLFIRSLCQGNIAQLSTNGRCNERLLLYSIPSLAWPGSCPCLDIFATSELLVGQ